MDYSSFPHGYSPVTLLDEGPCLRVYRGTCAEEKRGVLIKIPSPTADISLAREVLSREFAVLDGTECSSAIRPRKYFDGYPAALVLDDPGGGPILLEPKPRDRGLALFNRYAPVMAAALGDVHRAGLLHCALSPRCFYIRDEHEKIEAGITGFGLIDFRPSRGEADLRALDLAYLAPESSGRMAYSPGQAADLYSLGIIFYEMLTGIVPFHSDDPEEMIYWHRACTPVPPRNINGSIPDDISRFVLRLLAKNPSERYEGARELCKYFAVTKEKHGGIIPGLALPDSYPGKISLPDRIFGRERERIELYNANKRARAGENVFTVISGYAGIGKTVIAMELGDEARRSGGWFLHGKFEQYGSEPYSAVSSAFSRGIISILGDSNTVLAAWKSRIKKALGKNAGVIANLVHGLRDILGKTPLPPPVDPSNEENRLLHAFGVFAGLFAGKDQPLTLFLDDLQWADVQSLQLLRYLASVSNLKYFHLLASYRDNEVGDDHPLAAILRKMEEDGLPLHRMKLGPLDSDSVHEMLAALLRMESHFIDPLAMTVIRKTGGNPFYIKKFTTEIIKKGLISRDAGNTPSWDLAAVDALPVSDNVADFLISKMSDLPKTERDILKLLSCLGSGFDRGVARRCAGTGAAAFDRALRHLADEEYLVLKRNNVCAFVHDRVQEAAYSLMSGPELTENKLKIGRALLDLYGDDNPDALITIVDCLNAASERITDAGDRERLRELNRRAGNKAKKAAAFAAAAEYYGRAIELLAPDAWVDPCDGIFELLRMYAECLYLDGNYDEALKVVENALAFTMKPLRKVDLMSVLIHIRMLESRFDEVVTMGNEALSILGFTISKGNIEEDIREEYAAIDTLLEEKGVRFILSQPSNESQIDDLIYHIASMMGLTFFFTDPQMLHLLGLKMFRYTVMTGISHYSFPWIMGFCTLDAHFYHRYKRAYELGETAMERLTEERNMVAYCDSSQRFVNLVLPWRRPLRETVALNQKGLNAGMSYGDFDYACLTLLHMQLNNYHMGKNLEECRNHVADALEKVGKINNKMVMEILFCLAGVIDDMYFDPGEKLSYSASNEIDDKIKMIIEHEKNMVALFHYYIGIMHNRYLCGNYREALSAGIELIRFSSIIVGAFHHADRVFYHALSLIALLNTFDESEKARRMDEIRADLGQLTTWASNCPDNFLHRKLLVEAELARHRGEFLEAMGLYDGAIASARESGYIQIEAVACERAGEFWRGLGKEDFARSYFRAAYDRYTEWGATRKTALMETAHPWLTREKKRNSREEFLFGSMRSILESKTPRELVTSLAGSALKYSGADRLLFFVTIDGTVFLLADATRDHTETGPVSMEDVVADPHRYPVEMVRFVMRNGTLVSSDSMEASMPMGLIEKCPYIAHNNPKSFFCFSCETERGRVVWYFEHRTVAGVFTKMSASILDAMASYAAAAITRILRDTQEKSAPLTLKENGRNITVPFAVITHLESLGRKTRIHVPGATHIVNSLMKDMESKLPANAFMRIHRRYIVNTCCIETLKSEEPNRYAIILNDENKTRLPVGRTHLEKLKKMLNV